jgi:hypothetical protein
MDFFPKLSIFVNTRTPSQCRSHHQKIFQKFKCVSNITRVFKNEFGNGNYERVLAEGRTRARSIELQFVSKNSEAPLDKLPQPQNAKPTNNGLLTRS